MASIAAAPKLNPTARAKRRLWSAPVILLLAALPFTAPNILGGNLVLSLALSVAAAVIAVASDRGRIVWPTGSRRVIIFLALAGVWSLLVASNLGRDTQLLVQGLGLQAATLVAVAIVLGSRERAIQFARGFVAIVLILSASAAISLLLWFTVGSAGTLLGKFSVGPLTGSLYFPFTPTLSFQNVLGVTLPRFTGLGREPGWMSMYAGLAWFVWPLVGRPRWWGRIILLVGILAPVSTAGFGVFVVVLAYQAMLHPRPYKDMFLAYLRQMVGIVVVAGAAWIAIAAPVVGLGAKATQNEASLQGRNFVTGQGIDALLRGSLGENTLSYAPNVNIIASIVQNGWPYAALIVLAILAGRIGNPDRHSSTAPVAIVLLTLLLAQPPGGSTAVFALVIAVYAIGRAPRPLPAAETSISGPPWHSSK